MSRAVKENPLRMDRSEKIAIGVGVAVGLAAVIYYAFGSGSTSSSGSGSGGQAAAQQPIYKVPGGNTVVRPPQANS